MVHRIRTTRDLPIIQTLIAAGADANVSRRGNTPLHEAVIGRNLPIVRELIRAGANVNARDFQGRTPLFFAVMFNYSQPVVQELVNAGADINISDNDGNTPLHLIARIGDPVGIKSIIELGADPFPRNNQGFTAEGMASRWNHPEAADYLRDYSLVDIKEPEGM